MFDCLLLCKIERRRLKITLINFVFNQLQESSNEDESTKTPKGESKTEDTDESASADNSGGDDDKEKKDAKKSDDDNKDEEKSDLRDEPKSEKAAKEKKSSETSAEEEKEQKSDASAKKEKDEKPADTSNRDFAHEVYTGEVHDPNINPNERQNYRPINIMFRRKCQNPNIRIQFDRTVILKNQTYYLNVDGKNVRLIASPQQIETYEDIATLLQIVNDVSLNSCCVEPATQLG